jgi:hypothetical protein
MRISNLNKCSCALLCAIPLLGVSPLALADWGSSAKVEMRYDSNINNAQLSDDIASATVLGVGAAASSFFAFEEGNSLSISAEANGEVYNNYSGVNNVSLGATAAMRKKWALGAYAPWTAISVSAAHLNFDNNIRDGWRYQAALQGGKRILERWDVRAEYMLERRTAEELPPDQPGISGDVFSQSNRSLTLNAVYTWSDTLLLTFGTLWRHGDVVATTSETANMIASSQAIAADPVFGPHLYAYRMTASSYGLNVGMNIVVAERSLLRASMMRVLTHAEGDNDYARNVLTLSWNYNF